MESGFLKPTNNHDAQAVDPLDIASKVKDIEGKKEGRKAVREGSRADDAALPFVISSSGPNYVYGGGKPLKSILKKLNMKKARVEESPSKRVSLSPNILLHVYEDDQVEKVTVTGANDGDATANMQSASDKVYNSFASVLKHTGKCVAEIVELRNEECVEGAAVTLPLAAIEEVSSRFENTLYGYFVGKRLAYQVVENYVNNVWSKYGLKRIQLHGEFFLFQFETKEGMNRVLDYGSWLIRRVPLILNIWSPNCDLHKAEIKKVPVWVKLHNVPIVAYSEVGLSLITTQIGKPIQLDAYTSDMCLNSWGRSAYARALIEISADVILKEDLVIAIPIGKDKGHTLATIQIEYEWRPPRCSTCLIFDHTDDKCPKLPKVVSHDVVTNVGVNHSKDVADDGFEVVKKKRNKKKKHQKQVDGVVLSKPSLNLHYRRVDKGNSTKQSGSNVASTSKVGKATSTSDHTKNVRLENSFSVLNNDEESEWKDNTAWQHTQQVLNVLNESDSDVDEEITLDDRGGNLKNWLFKLWLEVNVALQLHSIVLIGLFGNIFYRGESLLPKKNVQMMMKVMSSKSARQRGISGKKKEFCDFSSNEVKCYKIRIRKVEENLHIRFLEDKPIIVCNRPKWLFDIDILTKSMNYVPVVAGTNFNDSIGTEESIGTGQSSKETGSSQNYILMPLWKDGSLFDSSLKNASNDEPQPSSDAGKKDD
ncbi:zinc knuckle CX2CX4HX4C containing protein [Tanacetum coccineum]